MAFDSGITKHIGELGRIWGARNTNINIGEMEENLRNATATAADTGELKSNLLYVDANVSNNV